MLLSKLMTDAFAVGFFFPFILCYEYRDRYNQSHYLNNFSDICSESAVGCELMIDTQNYSGYGATKWIDGEKSDGSCGGADNCVDVDSDKFIYMAYDQSKLCTPDNKGCQFLGRPNMYGGDVVSYDDVYLKNDPDRYESILCNADDVGCAEYLDDQGGKSWFKDPNDKVCEYRAGFDGSYKWWEKKVKRCDIHGDDAQNGTSPPNGRIYHTSSVIEGGENNMCLVDSDCELFISDTPCVTIDDCASLGENYICAIQDDGNKKCQMQRECILDEWDEECVTDEDVDNIKTIGIGGAGNRIPQPEWSESFAGMCPAVESGCTELIDPISKPSVNLLFNGDFSQRIGGSVNGWELEGGLYKQDITLQANTLYILSHKGSNKVNMNCEGSTYVLTHNNTFVDNEGFIDDVYVPQDIASKRFFTEGAVEDCVVKVSETEGEVELKEAMLGYQLARDLDNSSCNGQVNFEEGCVLFNKRSVEGKEEESNNIKLNELVYDADKMEDIGLIGVGQAPQICTEGSEECDSNELLKVNPDRVCDKWLACKSKVAIKDENDEEERICYDIGICDGFDEKNQCGSWVLAEPENQDVDLSGGFGGYANVSGYSKLGVLGISKYDMRGDYPLGKMEQFGGVTTVPNGGFESYGSNGYPTGWRLSDSDKTWDDSKFSVIASPLSAQTESISYPLEGASFLKYSPSQGAIESEFIDVEPGEDYILSLYVNTLNFNKVNTEVVVEVVENCGSGDCARYINNSLDWHKRIAKFRTGSGSRLKIKIFGRNTTGGTYINCDIGSETCVGNAYIDDIKIRPALETRIQEGDCLSAGLGYCRDDSKCSIDGTTSCDLPDDIFWYTNQSCRLYPESDSLSCSYYDDAGKQQKGWYGYCLEYDRDPGNPDACLLWWPVDRVKGDSIDDGAGYSGRIPLYYCLEGEVDFNTEWELVKIGTLHGGNWGWQIATGKTEIIDLSSIGMVVDLDIGDGKEITWWEGGGHNKSRYKIWVRKVNAPEDEWIGGEEAAWGGRGRGFDLRELAGGVGAIDAIKVKCVYGDSGACDSYNLEVRNFFKYFHCNKVVRTVTPTGQNKAWYYRVLEGSGYNLPQDNPNPVLFVYNTNLEPYGALLPPAPVHEPTLWDGSSDSGNQPLSILPFDATFAHGGTPYFFSYVIPPAGELFSRCSESRHMCIQNSPYFFNCPPKETCMETIDRGELPLDYEEAKAYLQHLFAQSYGGWTWNAGSTSNECNNLSPFRTCRYSNSDALGVSPDICSPACTDFSSPTCELTTIKRCEGGIRDGENCDGEPDDFCSVRDSDCISGGECSGETNHPGAECNFCTDDPCNVTDFDSIKEACWDIDLDIRCSVALGQCVGEGPHEGESCTSGADGDNYCQGAKEICSDVSTEGICKSSGVTLYRFNFSDKTYGTISCEGPTDCDGVKSNSCLKVPGGCSQDEEKECFIDSDCAVNPQYEKIPGPDFNWGPPDNLCYADATEPTNCSEETGDNTRPDYPCDLCAVVPKVNNIEVDGQNTNVPITKNGFVNLTFTTDVDDNQEPMVMYKVDWGDDETTTVSGVEMRDRPDINNPHSLYHLYDYWDLLRKKESSKAPFPDDKNDPYYTVYCGDGDEKATSKYYDNEGGIGEIDLRADTPNVSYCIVQPKVWIKDNWGWYSYENWGAAVINQTPTGNQIPSFDHWIVVKER